MSRLLTPANRSEYTTDFGSALEGARRGWHRFLNLWVKPKRLSEAGGRVALAD